MGPEPWSCLFRIADFEFSLQGTDRQLRELAECVYSGARIADGKRGRRYRLGRAEGRFVMSSGGKEICSQPALQEFFQDVELALTEEAMWSLDHFLQIHAAAAQVSGQKAVVLIGDHGAGKTTLVVALARLGARIFTDEVALLDPVRLELTPFRRDLILHTETQALFPDLSRGPEAPEFQAFCRVPLRLAEGDRHTEQSRAVSPGIDAVSPAAAGFGCLVQSRRTCGCGSATAGQFVQSGCFRGKVCRCRGSGGGELCGGGMGVRRRSGSCSADSVLSSRGLNHPEGRGRPACPSRRCARCRSLADLKNPRRSRASGRPGSRRAASINRSSDP